jgi:PIN domain nuclease of toxin-antitoxin system
LLLDTHASLWFVLDDPRLSTVADALIRDPSNQLEISPGCYWEMAIKISLGKNALPEPLSAFIEQNTATNVIEILHFQPTHAAAVCNLPFHHKDPFDRLLIAQALVERIPIVSADGAFDAYGVTRFW